MRSITVHELANKLELDVDTALVNLWTIGIDHVDSGSSKLSDGERRKALRDLGSAGSYQKKVNFWLDWLGLSRGEFSDLLASHGFTLAPDKSNIPKGTFRYLRTLPPVQADVSIDDNDFEVEAREMVPAPIFPDVSLLGSITHVSVEEVISIHDALEEDFFTTEDPISPPGIRDIGLLEGAVGRHSTSYGERAKYSTINLAGAALLHSLIHNHPFHNGNKRTALVSLLVFLDKNGFAVKCSQDELFREMIKIAAHEILDTSKDYIARSDHEVLEISRWVSRFSRSIRKEERSITWISLRQVLKELGCEFIEGKGQKIEIMRVVIRSSGKGIFQRSKPQTLRTSFVNTGKGREVPKTQLKRIRQELELDEMHSIDSDIFYGSYSEPDYFIREYSKILRRLAKV